ncbi:hypothetical protein [Pseudomonas putida]|uniref:Transmembrane protein n=1 Tax=Pseudomonas putida TaxID=303 RepID=A0A8I1EG77_PSEPU|nr:hypothetical protein [Pseudomonas putida]MBI6885170.1 hypothetical protein [Pseudomonas putida]
MDPVSPAQAFLEAHRIYLWISFLPLVLISIFSIWLSSKIKSSQGDSKWKFFRNCCRVLALMIVGFATGIIAYFDIIYLTGWTWLFGLLIFLVFPELMIIIFYVVKWLLGLDREPEKS